MASNDEPVPQTLIDFVFDLFDSVTASQIVEEQTRLYNTVFREHSAKYFSSTPWPSPQSIASECNGDPLFLAIYRELTHRHWHAISRPSVQDRIEGWNVYRDLFDEILDVAEEYAYSSSPGKFYLLPEWTFDILHEFVYQFQGFCQFRRALHTSASKHGVLGADENGTPLLKTNTKAPNHVVDNVSILMESGKEVWAAEDVFYYLRKFVSIGTDSRCKDPSFQYFGIFASVVLSRLECLLSDYAGSIKAMAPAIDPSRMIEKSDIDTKSASGVVQECFAARLSLAYHAGVSFVMLRRFKDASKVLGDLCSFMQRGFKTGQLKSLPNSDQFMKNNDRMIALLAICTHLCPLQLVDESLLKTIREKHGSQLGQGKITDLFVFCSPKFVSPAQPDFAVPSEPGKADNAYKYQIQMFEKWVVGDQPTLAKLRSYLRLYTSIEVSKIESFGNNPKDLVALKMYLRQLESNGEVVSLHDADWKSALDIHYYVEDGNVHIEEAEKQRRFENYFVAQIEQSVEIQREAAAISTDV